ncbi:MAG: YggT family protein [Armatimonadota bacterium]|nr:MAG: YggT family protein [Armatimonadota bacterium]
MVSVGTLISYAISVMMLAILASVIISWLRAFRVQVPYGNPLVRAIEETADLMLRPIRRAVPTAGGGLDFAPLIALIILSILQQIVARL